MAGAERDRRFLRALAVITLVGFAVRIAFVIYWRSHIELSMLTDNDSSFYHRASLLLADGHGFVNPFFSAPGHYYASADHPPVYELFLAFFAKLGLRSSFQQALMTATFLGTPSVWMGGLAGRQIRGPRTGLIAAALIAIGPSLFSWDAMVLSEPSAIFMVTLTAWAAYRYVNTPTTRRACVLAACAALAAMSRAELALLLPVVVLPLVLRHGTRSPREILRRLVVSGLAIAVIMGPWVGWNMVRFEKPVYLSVGFDITVSSATCDLTYYGPLTGYWHFFCAAAVRNEIAREHPPAEYVVDGHRYKVPALDQSQETPYFHRAWVNYVKHHKSRVPFVVLARLGRITGLYHPWQQATLEWNPEGRPLWLTRAVLFAWYPLALLAAFGVFVLRRRRTVVYPLLIVLLTVVITTALTFGTSRYRASAEPVICLLAAVGIEALIERRTRHAESPDAAALR